jgi:hypothetical protein
MRAVFSRRRALSFVLALLVAGSVGCGGADDEPCHISESSAGQVLSCGDEQIVFPQDGGTAQAEWKIRASIGCYGLLQDTQLDFAYQAAVLTSGDLFASGAIAAPWGQVGASQYYAASQVGAGTGAVIFAYDVAGAASGGWWELSLNRQSLVTTITYRDSDLSGGRMDWTMNPASCTVNQY